MKVVKKQDIINGLERLGLQVEVGKTKVKEWERLHVHKVLREQTETDLQMLQYVCKVSLQHGMLYTYTFKGIPDYYAFAIKLMLSKGVILNHINYLSLRVKAYNLTLHLLERANSEIDKKLKQKALLHYYWEKTKVFTSLFNEHYFDGKPNEYQGANYATN